MSFEKYRIGKVELVNRVVRSATADTDIVAAGRITESALNRYESLAHNNVGMIITGDFCAVNLEMLEDLSRQGGSFSSEKIMVEDLPVLPGRVHGCSDAKLIVQIGNDLIYRIPSYYDSFFSLEDFTPATEEEIDVIIECFMKIASDGRTWVRRGTDPCRSRGASVDVPFAVDQQAEGFLRWFCRG